MICIEPMRPFYTLQHQQCLFFPIVYLKGHEVCLDPVGRESLQWLQEAHGLLQGILNSRKLVRHQLIQLGRVGFLVGLLTGLVVLFSFDLSLGCLRAFLFCLALRFALFVTEFLELARSQVFCKENVMLVHELVSGILNNFVLGK